MKLNEYEIARAYVGKTCNAEKLAKTFKDNGTRKLDFFEGNRVVRRLECEMYIAYCNHFDDEEWELFGLTDTLYDSWDYRGIDFRVNVYTEQGRVVRCEIRKYKYTHIGFDRPSCNELTPTQQEIRVFRRIMEYITT